jgi:NAD(P)-dependent dehydrogenase (short-subunit alcohol dehydrogenase family)
MAGSTQAEIPSQLGRTVVVTGATGGLGYETARALAKGGSEVILTGRDDRKGRSVIEKISRDVTGAKMSYEHLDLASLASVADFAQRMHARHSLDLLINKRESWRCPTGKPRRMALRCSLGPTIWVTSHSRPG